MYGQRMALADVYDALISERVYKKPFLWKKPGKSFGMAAEHSFIPTFSLSFLSVYNTRKVNSASIVSSLVEYGTGEGTNSTLLFTAGRCWFVPEV